MPQEMETRLSEFDELLHPRKDDAELVEAFLPTKCVQNHAANLCVLPGGDLGCVWFGGTQEGMSDISVYFARLPYRCRGLASCTAETGVLAEHARR